MLKTAQQHNILCAQKKLKKFEKNLKKGVDISFAWCYINKAVAWDTNKTPGRNDSKGENCVPCKLNNVKQLMQISTRVLRILRESNGFSLFFWELDIAINDLISWLRSWDIIYWEFDPGSGRTLAACLTHASRTDARSLLLKLVADGWVMREQPASKRGTTVGNDC